MELLEGEPLSDRLKQGAMTVSNAMPIALEILEALSALHARGIVHRDLKPSNVFVTRPDGPDGAPCLKILDFGICATMDVSDGLTATNTMLGTAFYMAPEQIMSSRNVDVPFPSST